LVNYLRNDRKVFPEFNDKNSENMFYKEMKFWGIEEDTDYKPAVFGSSVLEYTQLQNTKIKEQSRLRAKSKDKPKNNGNTTF
jgi:hypothetical protein